MLVSALVARPAAPVVAVSDVQDVVPTEDPVDYTPQVLDGPVYGIAEVGDTVYVAGDFSQVRAAGTQAILTRNNLFAFDRSTGAIDSTWTPETNDAVDAIREGPGGTSVIIGGRFSTVNNVNNVGIAKLDSATGQMIPGFNASTAGRVRDVKVNGDKIFLGGNFWSVNGVSKSRIAVIDVNTGQLDPSFDVAVTQERVSNSWVTKLDVTPDGSTLVITGNFVEVDGLPRTQVAMIDLSANPAVVTDWETDRYSAPCFSAFWTYMRDVEFSADGEYFAIVTTGGASPGNLCDTTARWETAARGQDLLETWADWTGGDTLLSVAVTGTAIYVGGHQRWQNNHTGRDFAGPGAVPRDGIAALDPLNGIPLRWNPGKDRGIGVFDIEPGEDLLYIGSDSDITAGEFHPKLAAFPLAGGTEVPLPTPVALPADLHTVGTDDVLSVRSFDGSQFGSPQDVSPDPVDWGTVGAAAWEASTLYYTTGSDLFARPFDGSSFGSPVDLNAWNSWSGTTAMSWDEGRLYFTRAGQSQLRYHNVSLESGIVSSIEFVASGDGDGLNWTNVTGLSFADSHLYYTRSDDNLYRIEMSGIRPVPGTEEIVSGPAAGDGRTWDVEDLFFVDLDVPPTLQITTPTDGSAVSGNVTVAADAQSPLGVAEVAFLVDGVSLGTDTDGADGWSVSWDSTGAPDGTVTVTAVLTDAGNNQVEDDVDVTVDNSAPTVSLTAPADGSTVSGGVLVEADASDAASTVSVEFFVDGASIGVDSDPSDGFSAFWGTTPSDNGDRTVLATATDAAGFSASDQVDVAVENTSAGEVLYVVANPDSLNAGEAAAIDRLEGLTFGVSVIDDNGAAAADAAGASFVIISSTVSTSAVGDTFEPVAAPVWVAKPWLLDDMQMTGPVGDIDYGLTTVDALDVVSEGHPIVAGNDGVTPFTSEARTLSWGLPVPAGEVIATAAGNAAVFAIASGAPLNDNSVAAGCRLTFPLYQTAPTVFTNEAWTMFDAAATWAAGGCGQVMPDEDPAVVLTAPGDGAVVSGSVSLVADASDDVGVAQVEFFVGGVSVGVDVDGADGWSVDWGSTSVGDGAVTIEATATDTDANTATDDITVTVDNVAPGEDPVVGLSLPVDGAVVSGSVSLVADASDDVGVTQVEFFVDGVSVGVDVDGANGWTVDWDSTTIGDGAVTVEATATDTDANAATDSVTVTVDNVVNPAGSVLFAVGNPGGLNAGDSAVVARLEGLGHTVTVIDDNGIAASDSDGFDLVVVSSTVSSSTVAGTFRDVTVPVWVAKPWILDDMEMTGATGDVDYGLVSAASLTVVDAGHPTAAGRSGPVPFTTQTETVSFGVPESSASTVATSAGEVAVFAYDAGDVLDDGSSAAGCRVAFPLYQNAPTLFTDDAWAMFDATATWTINNCAAAAVDQPPTVAITSPLDGSTVWGDVTITADATDDDFVDQVEFFVGGDSIGTDDDGADGWSVDWVADQAGMATISAIATDSAGATAEDAVGVTADPPGPVNPDAEHTVVISVDGLRANAVTQLGPAELPNIYRLIDEGMATVNARTLFEQTITLPNHSSMMTGIPVDGPTGHGVDFNEDDGQTIHDSAGRYVPSIFDVAHDNGLSTLLHAGKPKFDFLDRSWDANNGAPDVVGADDGTDKIDHYLRSDGGALVDSFAALMSTDPINLSFFNFSEPDGTGHDFGWESPEYEDALRSVDAWVGEILAVIENDSELDDSSMVVLTSDHGGSGTVHNDPSLLINNQVPFMAWGGPAGAGGDLYAADPSTRLDPGAGRPDYTADPQPIRNADVANLVLEVLGLGPVPGSTINSAQDLSLEFAPAPDDPPTVAITAPGEGATVSGGVTVSADASDDDAVVEVEFLAGTNSLGVDSDGSDGWSVDWDSLGVADGNVDLTATATDTAAQTASDEVTVVVDNQPAPDHVLFGAHPGRGDRLQNLIDLEADLERQLDLVRVFEVWDSTFPEAFHDEIIDEGRLMLLSVRALRENGSVVLWRDIADAPDGSPIHQQIVTWAQRVKDLGVPVWFTFNHEPEFAGNIPNGIDQDFIDAWRRVHAEFIAQGVTNAEFVWIMTDFSFELPSTDRRHAPKWYPGDDVVDHIAADAYNWSDCRVGVFNPWRSLEEIIEPLRQFGLNHPDKGLLLAEWASTESGGSKADWIDETSDLFQEPGWEQFIALSYFNDIDPVSPACNWPVDSSPSSLDAMRAMGSLPFYGGDNVAPGVDPVVGLSLPVDGALVSGLVSLVADASDDVGVAQVEFFVGGVSVGVDVDGADGWSVDWDSTSVGDGAVSVEATATDTDGNTATDSVGVTVDNVVDPAGSVLLVVGNPGGVNAGDSAVVARLEGLGHSVTVVDDNGIAASDADGFDLVIVSATTSSSTVAGTLRDVAVPVWVAKPWILDDMEMTGSAGGVDYGLVDSASLTVVDAGHPMAAGRSGVVSFTAQVDSVSFGVPVASASEVATAAGEVAVFAYDAGDVLDDGSSAAGCRVSFPLYQEGPTLFTDDAWAMFDATATWTINNCV